MGSQAGPTTSSSSSAIGEKQVNPMFLPYLNDALTQGQTLYNMGHGAQPYMGPTQAALNPHLDQSLRNYQNMVDNLITNNAASTANNAAMTNISSGGLSPGMRGDLASMRGIAGSAPGQNADVIGRLTGMTDTQDVDPYLKATLASNNARIGNQVNSTMAGMGRWGSGSHTDVLARTLAESDNPILATAFENQKNRALSANNAIAGIRQADTGLGLSASNAALSGENAAGNRALQWAQLAPGLQSAAVAPYLMQGEIGNWQQDRLQKELDQSIAGYNAGQNVGWSQLAKYMGAIQGVTPAFAGTGPYQEMKQGESKTSTPFGIQQGLGLGMTAAGKMSDISTKTDIEKIGTHETTGLDIYAYRYKGDPKNYPKVVGPMAQDVQKRFPSAVGEVGGKLYIKPWAVAAGRALGH